MVALQANDDTVLSKDIFYMSPKRLQPISFVEQFILQQ